MWGLKTKFLLKYGTDITLLAEMGMVDPVIGREREMQLLTEALLKRRNSNACLVGDAGVGKTALVEALAIKIAANSVPPKLIGKRVFSIDMARLGHGAIHGGEFEKRVKDLLEEVRVNEGWVILFIDDLHNLIKNRGDGVATILKSALATKDFKCVGASRVEEYRRYVERDGALKSMFESIEIGEPSREECIKMVHGIFPKYQNHHAVTYSKKALISAVDLSKQYLRETELLLPGKAINLIDKAGARAHVLGKSHVHHADIEYAVSQSTGLRVSQSSLLELENTLKRSLIGQDEAVAAVCGCIRRARVGILVDEEEKEAKPIGCFLFVGPSGVGKTEMAKLVAKEYFGDEAALVRLDTRKSMECHTVWRLISQLMEEVRRRPHSLVLVDKIEKAHEQVLNVVVQMLELGRLTDGEGRTVDFSDTIVILTSNLREGLKAEVVNGLDQVVRFNHLEKEHIEKILDMMMRRLRARVVAKKKIHHVELSRRLKDWLVMEGYDKSYGARALKRVFASSVETKLGDEILCGRVGAGDTVRLDISLTGEVEVEVTRGDVKKCKTVKVKKHDTDRDRDRDRETVVVGRKIVECETVVKIPHRADPNCRVAIGGVDVHTLLPHLTDNHKLVTKDYTEIRGIQSQTFSHLLLSFSPHR